jgi:hypothetical protein
MQIASSHYMFYLLRTLKMMVNVAATSHPMAEYSALQHVLLFCFFFFQQFCFLFLSSFILIILHFLLLCYSLQLLNCILHTHASMNFRISKMFTTNNKQKQLSTIILYIFILELPTYLIHFLACPSFFN